MALNKLLTMWRVAYILVSMHPYIFSKSLCCENLYKTDSWRRKQTISDSLNTTNTHSWDVYANPDNGSSSIWAQKERHRERPSWRRMKRISTWNLVICGGRVRLRGSAAFNTEGEKVSRDEDACFGVEANPPITAVSFLYFILYVFCGSGDRGPGVLVPSRLWIGTENWVELRTDGNCGDGRGERLDKRNRNKK